MRKSVNINISLETSLGRESFPPQADQHFYALCPQTIALVTMIILTDIAALEVTNRSDRSETFATPKQYSASSAAL